MNAKPYYERIYGPMQAKTFPQVLQNWLADEFPHLGGPKVRTLFVTEIMQLLETYHVADQRLQPGQVLWYAVDKTDLPHDGQSMAETRLVPVILTLVTPQDIQRLVQGTSITQVRQHVFARMHREADAQGGVLAETDTSLLTAHHLNTVSQALLAYEHEHQCVIPRRGTVHDLGRSVSHKALIAKKAILEAKQAPDVAWETAHSVSSTERYLLDLMRVYISLKRRGMTVEEAAFATSLSISLVKEYAALIDELGLNDEQLSSIIGELEHIAQVRHPDSEPDASAGQSASDVSPPG